MRTEHNKNLIPYAPDGWGLVKVQREGYSHDNDFPLWDEGWGPVWVYRESLGIIGFVRARTWHEAWEACVDEIMLDAEPFEEWDEEDKEAYQKDGELPDGMIHRGGKPAAKHLTESIAQEDLNGSSLELLTLEFCKEHQIKLYWSGEDFEFTGRMVKA